MEKKVNRYSSLIRIICYILIPVCLLGIVQSVISLYYFTEQSNNIKVNNYYQTEQFTDLYSTSIINNVDACYYRTGDYEYEICINNLYGITQSNTKSGHIYYKTYLEDKNFKFLIIDNKTNKAFTNLIQTTKTDTIDKIKQKLSTYSYYWNYENGEVKTNIENLELENIKYKYYYKSVEENYDCKVYTAIEEPLKHYDDYYTLKFMHSIVRESVEISIINIVISLILVLVAIILITIFTGRKKGEREIQLDVLDKIPLEIVIFFVIVISIFAFILCVEMSYEINVMVVAVMLAIGVILCVIGIVTYETIVKRIKTNTLFKNTIIYRIFKIIHKTLEDIFNDFNLSVKIGLILGIFMLAIFIITFYTIFVENFVIGLVLLVFLYAIVFKYIYLYVKQVLEIKQVAKTIYEGNTEIRLKENEYKGVLKELSIYINDIASGLTNAVEEALKSERMKTELITNVSHDIKTPLTSIINYVDLLKKEEMPNKKAKEYLEILDQKSQRLKRLTEDLVEASKASSGNIKLNLEKLDVKELIKQVSGEYEDKFKDKKLELNLNIPKEDTFIKADSRYLYRVIENMYSNIVKYALQDSRVYVDIIVEDKNVKIELKNISKEKLNISADELMERFVRGESSRNTEGSGLGLSIAQSLTELQKGTFDIYLDGDLFKVTIIFESFKD